MKKYYHKPEILFEDFSLSTHIASDCEVKPDDDLLKYPGAGYVFMEGQCAWGVTSVGGIQIGDDYMYNKVCYHVLESGINVFSSY